MARPSDPESLLLAHDVSASALAPESDVVAELLSAEADFERGDYIDLTPEQLARCIATGESRLSTTFRRTLAAIAVHSRSEPYRAVFGFSIGSMRITCL